MLEEKTGESRQSEAISQYFQPRTDGDIDLVQAVRDELVAAGLMQAVVTSYDTNRFIHDAKNKPSSVQRFLLNRYWSLQLMSSTKPSTEERYCLIPNGTVQEWLTLFKSKVLPFVIENKLPVSI